MSTLMEFKSSVLRQVQNRPSLRRKPEGPSISQEEPPQPLGVPRSPQPAGVPRSGAMFKQGEIYQSNAEENDSGIRILLQLQLATATQPVEIELQRDAGNASLLSLLPSIEEEEGDGDIFEALSALQRKREIMHREYAELLDVPVSPPLLGSLGNQTPSESPRATRKELRLLYEEVLYTVLHRAGVPEIGHITDETGLFHYLQKAFTVDLSDHESMLQRAKAAKPPSFGMRVTVVEARNLMAKDANGFSDPYCMLGIMVGPATREHEERKERRFSFRRKKEKMEKRASVREGLPAKYIQVTEVKPSTLNPVWNHSYVFELDDIQSDQLHLDIWDHDDEVSVAEACKKLNEVSSFKGMGRYFKQIVKSARTNREATSAEDNADDFLGCLNIPINEITVDGIDKWFRLEPRSSSSSVQGECHLVMKLIVTQKDAALFKKVTNTSVYELLLTRLLQYEHVNFETDHYSWAGSLSHHADTILSHHAMQLNLSPAHKAAVEWQAYSKHHQSRSMDYAFLLQLLLNLEEKWEPGDFSREQEQALAQSFSMFSEYTWALLHKLRQVFPFNITVALRRLELILRCMCQMYSMPVFAKVSPFHNELHVELTAVMKKATSDWYEKMSESFKLEMTSELGQLKALVELVDMVCLDLQRNQNVYNKLFISIVKVDYFSLTYRLLEKQVAEDVNQLMEEVTEAMEEGKARMTQQMGEILFELYLSLKELQQLKDFLPLRDSKSLALVGFHDWFQSSINKWLQIVHKKSCERIRKAVEMDQLEPVDSLSRHSSSAVDVVTCFSQIRNFWLQLAWPDPMGAFIFITRITDDICSGAVLYSELIRQKAEIETKISQQLCIALNNIEHVQQYISELPGTLDWHGVEVALEQLCGPDGKQQVQKALSSQLQSIDIGMQREAKYTIQQIVAKMDTDSRKYLQHISLSPDSIQPDDAVSPLMKFLDDNLMILSEWLVRENLSRILSALWKLLLDLIEEILAENRGLSMEFYGRFHFTLEALVEFFHAEGQGLSLEELRNKEYQGIEEELRLNKCTTRQLIEQFFLDKLHQQKSMEHSPYGTLVIKLYYNTIDHKLHVLVLHATNLIALDSNGLSDPFVIVHLAPHHSFPGVKGHRTQVKTKTLHPVYDEHFHFTVSVEQCRLRAACIHLTVMDHDWLSTNDFAGEAVSPLGQVPGLDGVLVPGGLKNTPALTLKLTHPGSRGNASGDTACLPSVPRAAVSQCPLDSQSRHHTARDSH
ncbi:BAI1-associated protein 3 [Callorhinchus milii]|uniref:BAI1-associated protein 3 n=1 Tax=Callorhinchus milii TaxID=7868 RepID=UPI001C3FEADE|nr:BAI1-associated protein 3 [Callorhinchus milii]